MIAGRASAGKQLVESLAAGCSPPDLLPSAAGDGAGHGAEKRNGHAKGAVHPSEPIGARRKRGDDVDHGSVNLSCTRENFPSFALRVLDRVGLDRSGMLPAGAGDAEWDRRAS